MAAAPSSAAAAASPPPPPSIDTIPSIHSGPLTHSYTWASPVPTHARPAPTAPGADAAAKGAPCLMGIDEAGRGPVLGPMVYAVAYAPIAYAGELKAIGFADSKALTAERRDALLRGLILNPDNLGWAVRVLSPQDISAGMLRRHPYNLNSQALDATVALIQNVLDSGVDLTEIYVDTLGKAETHQKNLQSHFPRHKHIKWTVTSKADAIYPIVGAASIAAKVTRDRILEGWVYREPGLGRVLMLAPERVGRGEHARGSTAGLLGGAEDEHLEVLELPGKEEEAAGDGEGRATADAAATPMEGVQLEPTPTDGGPSAGAGKRKRTASTKLLELAEAEADMALRRTMRKTAQLRAAAAAARGQPPSARDSAPAAAEPEGLTQSPNPAFANVGSGYPSDPNTVAFLKATLDPVFGWPGIARFSWGTIRAMLEPPASATAKKGKTAAAAKGKGKASSSGGGRALRSAGEPPAASADDTLGEVADDDASVVIKPPKQGYPIRWADEQREAASAAVTSISKFFAPVAKNSGTAANGSGAAGEAAGDDGPLGRTTIARLEDEELKRARVPMWKDLGLAPVGSTAFQL